MELHLLTRKDVGFWGDSLSIVAFTRNPITKQIGIAKPLEFTSHEEGEVMPSELTIGGMKIESATRLMDSLWECGIRPSFPATNQDSEIRAMKAHIEDLRKLLWNRIGMEAP